MAKQNDWKFITASFIVSQRFKGIKTPAQVKSFAIKNDVFCGWWKNANTKGSHFLVEFNSFKKAYQTFTKQSSKTATGHTSTRKNTTKSHKTSKFTRKTTRYGRTYNRGRSHYTSRRAA